MTGRIRTRDRRELLLTRLAIAVTAGACALLAAHLAGILTVAIEAEDFRALTELVVFAIVVGFLIYGNFVYQFSRAGRLRRQLDHRPASRENIERLYDRDAPALAILVPSFREEVRVVRQTLYSAALVEYPRRRVVLLIDDRPALPGGYRDENTDAVRRLPGEIQTLLRAPAERFQAELAGFLERRGRSLDLAGESLRLSRLYEEAALWLETQAADFRRDDDAEFDHTDTLFLERILLEPARAHRERAAGFASRAGHPATAATILREYRRLAALFHVALTSFERKRYANLSHEPNKAMNLNSYIGLLGKSLREVKRRDGSHIEACAPAQASLQIPDADYLITLDADSLLLSDYALRLIDIMERPGNERLAVAQTPYNAFPGAPGLLERVAGATTDVQHFIHQGFTAHGATYWVGANALVRLAALEDICTITEERGYPVPIYIQDRTVIEDTESSVDLIRRGWSLYNYPDHLAYSATPPDFGALLIQRRRWANGGLIILPKLLGYLGRGPLRLSKLAEGLIRVHYLVSLTAVSVGILILLSYPFEDELETVWLPLTALPYFLLYGRDLVRAGYGWMDLPRVYALNLALIPIHLGGILKSLQQGWTGQKIPFSRTPKTMGRTKAPRLYVLAELALLLLCIVGFGFDLAAGRWLHAAFSLVNGLFFLYAVVRFVGAQQIASAFSAGRGATRTWPAKAVSRAVPEVPRREVPAETPSPLHDARYEAAGEAP